MNSEWRIGMCPAYWGSEMKLFTRRTAFLSVALLASASLAQAHPGHDGHDFSWDFRHLADYPDATILCFGVIGAIGWFVWKVISAKAETPKTSAVRVDDSRREN